MNAGVITKIEYQLPGDADFTNLDFIPESCKFNQEPARNSSGVFYTAVADFLIAGIDSVTDSTINLLNFRPAYFRLTDSKGVVFMVGTEQFPARMTSKPAIDGSAGSFRGYRCAITQHSTSACEVIDPS